MSQVIVVVVMMALTFSLLLNSLVPLFLHLLEQLFVVWKSLLVDYLPDFPLDAASDNPIDRVLFALNDLLPFL